MMFIRVWRSLVSRLTGGQEAAGSSPVTRTIEKTRNRKVSGLFRYFLFDFIALAIEKSGLSNTFV